MHRKGPGVKQEKGQRGGGGGGGEEEREGIGKVGMKERMGSK